MLARRWVFEIVLQRRLVNVDQSEAGPQLIMYRADEAKYDFALFASFSLIALNHAIAVRSGVDGHRGRPASALGPPPSTMQLAMTPGIETRRMT
jgi:hypothetical protein